MVEESFEINTNSLVKSFKFINMNSMVKIFNYYDLYGKAF